MARQEQKDDQPSKDHQKRTASSFERAHITSVMSKFKIVQNGKEEPHNKPWMFFSQQLMECLTELDQIEEISVILQALKFSDPTWIYLDPRGSDLSKMVKSEQAEGWYNYKEGELLIGAEKLATDRKYFMGVFAHELTHWCLQLVYKNNCLPYYQSDPKRVREDEFKQIVHDVQKLSTKISLDPLVQSVFENYAESSWPQELIVRVPHLMANNGVQEAVEILSIHQPTRDLLYFYRHHVMAEIRKFIADGDFVKCRETVAKLNDKLGLIKLYREYGFQFSSQVNIDLQSRSLWVYSSPYPYSAFFKIAWTLNCQENTELFFEINLFCDYESFVANVEDVTSTIRDLELCNTLIIVCPYVKSRSEYKKLFGRLEDVLAVTGQKRIILTIHKNMVSLTKRQLKAMKRIKHILVEDVEFDDFRKDTQEMIVNFPIDFVGNQIRPNMLLGEGEWHPCCGNLVERLIRSKLGYNRVTALNKEPFKKYHLPNFVTFYETLSTERLINLIRQCCKGNYSTMKFSLIILGDLENYPEDLGDVLCETLECDDLHEISIETVELFETDCQTQVVKPVLLFPSCAESEYYRLVSAFRKFCSFEVCFFVKVVSEKDISSDIMFYPDLLLRRALNTEELAESENYIDQDKVMEVLLYGDERVSILSDNAGSGKTHFLNQIYYSTFPCWAIKCSLKLCVSFIDEHPLESGILHEQAVSFILKMGQIEDPFAVDLLKLRMLNEIPNFPVVLLLDGFDEITSSDRNEASNNKEKIANLITFLKNRTYLRVVIATRQESATLLSHLSCPVYNFTALSSEQCEAYLINVCVARSKLFSKPIKSSGNSALEIVKKYTGGFTDVSQDFFKNPLHVSMLSDIIVENMKEGTFKPDTIDSEGNIIPHKLYDAFINNKYRVYFKEKRNSSIDERLIEQCNSAFEILAFYSLFGHENSNMEYFRRNKLFKRNSVNLDINQVKLYYDIGIIASAGESYVEFVHQTFAEYFVSCLFMSWADDISLSERWIVDVIYQPHRTLSFLDSMLVHATFTHELTKRHGEIMSRMGFDKTISAIRMHMWFDRLNILEYIFKCWKCVNQFSVILDPKSYKNHGANIYPLLFASQMCTDRILELVLKENFDINYKYQQTYVITSLFKRADVVMLKRCVEGGLLKNEVLKDTGRSLVYQAAASGKIELLEWLETLGYEILQFRTLESAVRHGHLNVAKWLKHRGVSIFNNSGVFERSLIHVAVIFRRFAMIRWLMDEGLDINIGDINGTTPLHCATIYGHLDMVRFLVESGANVRLRSKSGKNAMHYAASEKLTKLDLFKWLAQRGSEVDEPSTRGRSAVHLALKYVENKEVVGWLLSETKDITARDDDGRGYAHYAATNRRRFHFELVISKNCDVQSRDKRKKTAAHLALDTMGFLEPYDEDTDESIKEYNIQMVEPFKLLLTKIMENNFPILEELLSYAKERVQTKSSRTLESTIAWMEVVKSNLHK